MKKFLSSLLTASLIASSVSIAPVANTKAATTNDTAEDTSSVTDLSKYESNEVIVVYKKDANATKKKTLGICSLSKEEEENASVDSLTDNSVVLSLDSKDALADAVDALSNDSRVDYIQPNYVYRLTDTDISSTLETLQKNTDFSKQWAFYNDGTLSYEEYDYRTGGSSNWWPWNLHTSANDSAFPGFAQYETIRVTAKNRVDINLPEAWNACASSKRETIVAFVDTGIKYDHAELKDAMWVNEDEIAGDGIDNDNNGFIDDIYGWNFYEKTTGSWFWGMPGNNSSTSENGNNEYYNANSTVEDAHGTHGAGSVVAANNSTGTVGVAANSNVKVMSVKALGGDEGYGTTESVVKGIQYAEANGATICNLSLGGEEDDASLRSVIENSKMLFTIAAGNGDTSANAIDNDKTPTYPASYNFDNVITVANLQCDGTLHYSSNYGATSVDLAAPGSNIYSTSTDGSGYETMTGTSMAAPIVAGVAAMLYSSYDNLSITDVKNIIMQTTTKFDALDGKCVSGGMLNAYSAVTYAESGKLPDATAVPASTPDTTPDAATATPATQPAISAKPQDSARPTATAKPTRTPGFNRPTRVPTITKAPASTAPANTNEPATTVPDSTNTPPTSKPNNTKTPATDIPVTSTPDGNSTSDKNPISSPKATSTPTTAPLKTNTPAADVDFLEINNFSISGDSTRLVGETYRINATAKGGTGNYQYRFAISKNGTTKKFQAYSTQNYMDWTPSSAGSYVIRVSVKDANGDYDVRTQTVAVSKFGISKICSNKALKKGVTVKLKATLKSGKAPYTYQFNITRSGKKVLSKNTKNNYIKWKITKTGTYKIKVKAKDSLGNSASKTTTCKIKK